MTVTKSSDKTRIAKNTLFLYFRMLFVMGVSIYTSRVVLEILGIVDYGIYQTIGGIVGMMTFVHSSLSNGTSRFITFELGRNNPQKLERTFSTSVTTQIFFAVILIVIAETVGVWFVSHKLQIDSDSMGIATWVFQISVLTTVAGLISVPYFAAIIAHERMNVFAYLGIFDVCAKLGIVYLLTIGDINRLVLYAALLLSIQIIVTLFSILYCYKNFSETRYRPIFDKPIFKDIAGFSGWSLFAAGSIALNNQGILVLLYMFFSPAVVTARSISLQVNGAANQFISNFRTAVNPQIVKQYAAGNFSESKSLLLASTKYSYFLMLLISLPVCISADQLLHVWLVEVPDYTVIFLQLVIIQSLFQIFDTSFYTALYAKGDLKANALISPTLGFLMFPIVYLMFKSGYSPVSLSWASLVFYAILGLIVKPILIIKIVDYTWHDIFTLFRPCIVVSIIAGTFAFGIDRFVNFSSDFIGLVMKSGICLCTTFTAIYAFGLSREIRNRISNLILARVRN